MKKIVIFIGIFGTIACSPVYVPNVVNVPLHNNKDELQIACYTGIAGIDPQISYAISDDIALMCNGSFVRRGEIGSDNFRHQNFLELGLGYFSSISKKGRFEVYGGGGYGSLQSKYSGSLWDDYNDVSLIRYFVQPAIGIRSAFGDISFASRFVFVHYNQANIVAMGAFAEPVITMKVGYRYVKAVAQLGFSLPVVNPSLFGTTSFKYQPLLFSLGIQAILHAKYE